MAAPGAKKKNERGASDRNSKFLRIPTVDGFFTTVFVFRPVSFSTTPRLLVCQGNIRTKRVSKAWIVGLCGCLRCLPFVPVCSVACGSQQYYDEYSVHAKATL